MADRSQFLGDGTDERAAGSDRTGAGTRRL
jgi:hypothetical protein